MMNDTDILIEVAKLDGWNHWFNGWNKLEDNTPPLILSENLPQYLTSRDAIIPVIEKCKAIIRNNQDLFVSLLWREMKLKSSDCSFEMLLATPRQLCIALLKATGRWKE